MGLWVRVPPGEQKIKTMGKIEKKRAKILERIKFLEDEMILNLKQKTSNTAEISLSDYQHKIAQLRKQLEELK